MIELQDEQPPADPPRECETIDGDGSSRTCDDFGRIISGPQRWRGEVGRDGGL